MSRSHFGDTSTSMASMSAARDASRRERPPVACVVNTTSTRRQFVRCTSGWWLASSAASDTLLMKASAAAQFLATMRLDTDLRSAESTHDAKTLPHSASSSAAASTGAAHLRVGFVAGAASGAAGLSAGGPIRNLPLPSESASKNQSCRRITARHSAPADGTDSRGSSATHRPQRTRRVAGAPPTQQRARPRRAAGDGREADAAADRLLALPPVPALRARQGRRRRPGPRGHGQDGVPPQLPQRGSPRVPAHRVHAPRRAPPAPPAFAAAARATAAAPRRDTSS